MAKCLSREIVKIYFMDQMGNDAYTVNGKRSIYGMFSLYMDLMNNKDNLVTYPTMSLKSLEVRLAEWAREEGGFLIKEGRGSKALYSKREDPLPDFPYYLEGLKFGEPCKFSKLYERVNKILCGVLRKEHR